MSILFGERASIPERTCEATADGSGVTSKFLRSIRLKDDTLWKAETKRIFDDTLENVRHVLEEGDDQEKTNLVIIERTAIRAALERVALLLASCVLLAEWDGEAVEYTWERDASAGNYGRVAFMRLHTRLKGAPMRIAVKYGLTMKNHHEMEVISGMNRVDLANGGEVLCGRMPAFLVTEPSDEFMLVAMRPAEGDLHSLFASSEKQFTADAAVSLCVALLKELECIRIAYGLVMLDLKPENVLYSCVPGSAEIEVTLADYGGFGKEGAETQGIAVTYVPPWGSVSATQKFSLFGLFALFMVLTVGREAQVAIITRRDLNSMVPKLVKHEKIPKDFAPWLFYLASYTLFGRPGITNSLEDEAKWFLWKDQKYASTYSDALAILDDVVRLRAKGSSAR